jgi:hypothetical protein
MGNAGSLPAGKEQRARGNLENRRRKWVRTGGGWSTYRAPHRGLVLAIATGNKYLRIFNLLLLPFFRGERQWEVEAHLENLKSLAVESHRTRWRRWLLDRDLARRLSFQDTAPSLPGGSADVLMEPAFWQDAFVLAVNPRNLHIGVCETGGKKRQISDGHARPAEPFQDRFRGLDVVGQINVSPGAVRPFHTTNGLETRRELPVPLLARCL